jgi:response regulator RpfG family c-di-GMP phosphodiesterase
MKVDLDEDLLFADEDDTGSNGNEHFPRETWKVLIVDDEEEVHQVTKIALRGMAFDGKLVEFISAYSAKEGKMMLETEPEIAVILLDVVMEGENDGLRLVRLIRRDLGNRLVRIVLRTGQPGQAPEHAVLTKYDINDYKEKTELTTQKLFTTLITALRSYRDLKIIDNNRKGLREIIAGSISLFQLQTLDRFAVETLGQFIRLLGKDGGAGIVVGYNGNHARIIAATGVYNALKGREMRDFAMVDSNGCQTVGNAVLYQQSSVLKDEAVMYFPSAGGQAAVVYMKGFLPLQEWEKKLFEVLAANVSIALENIFLNLEVEDTQREIIFTLGEIAEARSRETGHHVKRVAEIARVMALRHGLSNEEADMLALSSSIHDLGKLAIPDVILNKPGKLTPEEFEIMKGHAQLGCEMLRSSKRTLLMNAAVIAAQHHERYDGKGYPQGLSGGQIHIYGRIVALADVFDALSSKRVYKSAWDIAEVTDYIRQQRGRQFDPELVDLMLDNLQEITEICERYRDKE